jgi:RNA polymerase sigma factor (sigma-70 family)
VKKLRTNPEAAELVATRLRRQVYAIAFEHSKTYDDAEDAFGRTVEIVLRACPAPASEPGQVMAWATTVCKREAWKIARRYRRKPTCSIDAINEDRIANDRPPVEAHDRTAPETLDLIVERERAEEVRRALGGLTEVQREVADRWADGLSYDEIGEATGMSYGGVNKAIQRGRKNLRRELGVAA